MNSVLLLQRGPGLAWHMHLRLSNLLIESIGVHACIYIDQKTIRATTMSPCVHTPPLSLLHTRLMIDTIALYNIYRNSTTTKF
jgi:hypothetical protein